MAYTFEYEKSAHLMWLPEKLVDLEANIAKEVEGVGQRQHFSHQHDLILSNEELMEDMLCDDCLGLISTLFYSCIQCNLFLHGICAQLPRKKCLFLLYQHQLTIVSHAPYKSGRIVPL